jgi:hypothetical protein
MREPALVARGHDPLSTALELDFLTEGLYRGRMPHHQEIGDLGEGVQTYQCCREALTRLLRVA